MCVFNFFFRKSWLAGEGDHLLRKKKLKMEFCGCSDTRRAFSRACIAKSAYHKPSLSRRMGAALPLRPCGSATRRRPSRRGPQRPWGHRAGAPPPGKRASGVKAQTQGGKGISNPWRTRISSQSTKCRSPFACSRSAFPRSEIKFEARRPECARFCQANWPVRPEMALGRAPRGLTRRCRRRFHFFIAPRSALGAFIFSAHGAPTCSLLSGRILSEMKQQQQQQQQQQAREALQDLHNKHAREEERQPPCKRSCCITRSFSCSSSK